MNDEQRQLYKKAGAEIFMEMMSRYPGGFYRGNQSQLPKAIGEWISKSFKLGITLEDFKPFYQHIMQHCPETTLRPPEEDRVPFLYSNWRAQVAVDSSIPSEFQNAFDSMYSEMSFRYERLWGKTDQDSMKSHKAYWRDELLASKIEPLSFAKVVRKVRASQEFKIYPPNIDQFLVMAKICSIDESLPSPDEAFVIAISQKNPEGLHPLIRKAREKFGYIALINKQDRSIRASFENEYLRCISLMSAGELDLSPKRKAVENEQPPLEQNELQNRFNSLLENLQD